ncbi:methyltransferase-domain-containing protein [Lineolata rhizophorae]|uniref:Ribosomal RNA-processing protein 8 n=1 Tax=Lineolata rhizophorae TaxID=578093 RepID=A0A6A6NM33_9PEZI|nr:methyltransferase-domain-containing protein [Lineolata rhizophorae]
MFAVPGWNLSAAVKTQTDAGDKPAAGHAAATGANGTAVRQRGHKRKRAPKDRDVTDANVAELWEEIVEGKKRAGAAGPGKKEKKRRMSQDEGAADRPGATAPKLDKDGDPRNGAATPANERKSTEKKQKRSSKQTNEKKQDGPRNKANAPDPPTSKPSAASAASSAIAAVVPPPAPANTPPTASAALTPLQAKMARKLASARFRHLNQTLYTTPSADALALFARHPDMFADYHAGFRQQVAVWPENPVDAFVAEASAAAAAAVPPLPRTRGTCTVADVGCGDAALAAALGPRARRLGLALRSFDLRRPEGPNAGLVTVADAAALPVADGGVDVVVFCLALMGTNWVEFVDEAWRVLRGRGELWVAEIKSRFGRKGQGKEGRTRIGGDTKGSQQGAKGKNKRRKKRKGGEDSDSEAEDPDEDVLDAEQKESRAAAADDDETDVSAFVDVLAKHGFLLSRAAGDRAVDTSNKMFVRMTFVKAGAPSRGKNARALREMELERMRDGARGGGGGVGAGGRGQWGGPRLRFIGDGGEEDVDPVEEGKVLKPCVYKLR